MYAGHVRYFREFEEVIGLESLSFGLSADSGGLGIAEEEEVLPLFAHAFPQFHLFPFRRRFSPCLLCMLSTFLGYEARSRIRRRMLSVV